MREIMADSAPCALYQIWWAHHLRLAAGKTRAPDPAVRALLMPRDMSSLIETLTEPDARFGADPRGARRDARRDARRCMECDGRQARP